jgi:nicotinamidase/pyrazinamidase
MLFVIDMQNDYVDQERGKMAVKGADQLVERILKRIEEYEAKQDKIFYTIDIHEEMEDDHRSKEERDWGQELYPPLKEKLSRYPSLEKTYYAISPEQAEEIRNKYQNQDQYIREIELVGVETNVCLLTNAILIRNLFPDSKLIIDKRLCASSDTGLHEKTLEIMESLKMEIRCTE